jgi:serine/threonine protein kinase
MNDGNPNAVDSGPWFDPDELTPRQDWEKIGDGSFGKVYKAHLLGIPVAVKVIQNLKPDRVAGLKRDIFYLSRLTHPNVVPVYGAFIEEGMLHMVMEFVPNSLRNKRVVNQVNVVKVLADVARALVRMHAQGHIHRDVKARNVLISAVSCLSFLRRRRRRRLNAVEERIRVPHNYLFFFLSRNGTERTNERTTFFSFFFFSLFFFVFTIKSFLFLLHQHHNKRSHQYSLPPARSFLRTRSRAGL